MTNVHAVNQSYPQCAQAGVNLATVYVPVHASVKGNGLNHGSAIRLTVGMVLWVSIVIHILGMEVYVRATRVL
jgi:hypothetical protein